MTSRSRLLLVLLVALAAAGLWASRLRPGRAPRYESFTEEIMASPVTVVAPAPVARDAADTVFEIFREVEAAMSEWKASSPLSAVNRAAGVQPVPVPEELRRVIRRGVEIGDLTDGAFDVTWAALWGLWDFTSSAPTVPGDEEIAGRAALVDYRRVEIDGEAGTVYLPKPGMMIGLGGIAKGYALDRAAAALREQGIESFLISAAGQMMLGGRRGERLWRVGIRDPRGGPDDSLTTLELTDVSVSTSGDYEQFFMKDGVRYHHILDPRTGRPSRHARSATVITPDATLADALSTALMILDTDRALALVETLPDVEAIVVDDKGTVRTSSGARH